MFLFIVSALAPMTFGIDIDSKENSTIENFDRYLYPEYYDSYHTEEISSFIEYENVQLTKDSCAVVTEDEESSSTVTSLDGSMDSPWPMHGHDTRHTGRSPYSTINTWDEKWIFKTSGPTGSPAIDKDGNIYVGSYEFYAVYPNGTLKWVYDTGGIIESCCPAIDENGIIYVGTAHAAYGNYLYAFYPNGTLKWRYKTGHHIMSSPVIGEDGTIYFGDWDGNINALNPDGTEKWVYLTGDVVTSSPAIGLNGMIYCGSHDNYVYAFYPNNGTVKWKYNTGNWVHGSPTIGDDGTVYIGSDNGYLYAFYPNNGTIRWKCSVGCIDASLALDKDGTLYIGVWEEKFYAINPNGTIKWSFNPGAKIWGSSPTLSDDDTIYFGTCDLEWTGGIEIIALYTDGTLKWRKELDTVFSSPAIGEDGTVYIGASGLNEGYLYTFGYPGPNPFAPTIIGPSSGKLGTSYPYTFTSIDPDNDQLSYYIDWNDGDITDWTDFQPSGDSYSESHTWTKKGDYQIKVKAKDTADLESVWSDPLSVTMPRNRVINNPIFIRFIEGFMDRFPFLERLIQLPVFEKLLGL